MSFGFWKDTSIELTSVDWMHFECEAFFFKQHSIKDENTHSRTRTLISKKKTQNFGLHEILVGWWWNILPKYDNKLHNVKYDITLLRVPLEEYCRLICDSWLDGDGVSCWRKLGLDFSPYIFFSNQNIFRKYCSAKPYEETIEKK